MMEPVEMPEMVDYKIDPEKKPWACTGWKPGDDPAKRGQVVQGAHGAVFSGVDGPGRAPGCQGPGRRCCGFQDQERADRSFTKIGMSFHSPLRFLLATVTHCGW